MKDIPILYQRKEDCCGCTACYAICPKGAIRMEEDEEGFEYPKIDKEKCVRCHLCMKVCPIKSSSDWNKAEKIEIDGGELSEHSDKLQ